MNAVKFLIKEHNKVRAIFADIANGSHRDETRLKMFNALCIDLIVHETLEQKAWYPELKKKARLTTTINHLITEEKTAAKAIAEFTKIKTQAEWEKKFLKLKRDVEHHAKEEETKLFPYVEKMLTEKELDELGKQMRAFKAELTEEIHA